MYGAENHTHSVLLSKLPPIYPSHNDPLLESRACAIFMT